MISILLIIEVPAAKTLMSLEIEELFISTSLPIDIPLISKDKRILSPVVA
jgi:hypothetical protein